MITIVSIINGQETRINSHPATSGSPLPADPQKPGTACHPRPCPSPCDPTCPTLLPKNPRSTSLVSPSANHRSTRFFRAGPSSSASVTPPSLGWTSSPTTNPDRYDDAVEFIQAQPLALGALVTTHKMNLLAASRDLFDKIDPLSAKMGEVSSIYKRGAANSKAALSIRLTATAPGRFYRVLSE